MKGFKLSSVFIAVFTLYANVYAGASEEDLGTVVVTPNRISVSTDAASTEVRVITADDIRKKGSTYLSDVLADIPGVSFNISGKVKYVSVRGSDPGNTLVFIDGVRVNDPSSISAAYDFGNLLAESVERIEVIGGASGAVYGSQASGGIINITTLKGTNKNTVNVNFETGSYNTTRESASFTGSWKNLSYALSTSHLYSKGYSQADIDDSLKPDDDPYSSNSLSGKVGIKLKDNMNLAYSFMFNSSDFQIDDAAETDDLDRNDTEKSFITGAVLEHSPFTFWDYSIKAGYNRIKRTDDDKSSDNEMDYTFTSWYKGQSISLQMQNNFYIGDIETITAGVEYLRDSMSQSYNDGFSNSGMDDVNAWTASGYVQNMLSIGKRLFHNAAVRFDRHKEFGSEVNWQTGLSFVVPFTDTRLKTSYSTGFKAPSLYQMYVDDAYTVRNRDLKAEESRTLEAGLEQAFLKKLIVVNGTWFYSKYKNKIEYSSDPVTWVGQYYNVGESTSRGIESSIQLNIAKNTYLKAGYLFMKTENLDTGKRLYKRPEHRASAEFNAGLLDDKANLNISFNYTGERDENEGVTLDSYWLLNVKASYDLFEWLEAYIRMENVTGNDYTENTGYTTPGFSVYGGVTGRIDFI